MIGAALRRRVTRGAGIVDLRATLAGGLAALLTAREALGAVAPSAEVGADPLLQDSRRNDDEDKQNRDDDKNNDHHDRGGRPDGYRHDRGPNLRDDKDDSSSETTDDSESTDEDAPPAEGDAPKEGDAPPAKSAPAPAEDNTAPAASAPAPVVDDASGGDNVQEGIVAPAASPVPASAPAPIAAAPSDVDFVS